MSVPTGGPLHVNLSACSLVDTNFCVMPCCRADLAPRLCAKLCFEITETVAIANPTEVASFVNGSRAGRLRGA